MEGGTNGLTAGVRDGRIKEWRDRWMDGLLMGERKAGGKDGGSVNVRLDGWIINLYALLHDIFVQLNPVRMGL
jgi:hypothetical protein